MILQNFDSDNYYERLGVSENATFAQIREVYLNLMRQFHPDHNPGGEEITKKITEANATLSDDKKRAQYDRILKAETEGDELFENHHAYGKEYGDFFSFYEQNKPFNLHSFTPEYIGSNVESFEMKVYGEHLNEDVKIEFIPPHFSVRLMKVASSLIQADVKVNEPVRLRKYSLRLTKPQSNTIYLENAFEITDYGEREFTVPENIDFGHRYWLNLQKSILLYEALNFKAKIFLVDEYREIEIAKKESYNDISYWFKPGRNFKLKVFGPDTNKAINGLYDLIQNELPHKQWRINWIKKNSTSESWPMMRGSPSGEAIYRNKRKYQGDPFLVIASGDKHIYAFRLDGTIFWQTEVNTKSDWERLEGLCPAAISNFIVFTIPGGYSGNLVAAVDFSGNIKWITELQSTHSDISSPVVADGLILVSGYNRLNALDYSGKILWISEDYNPNGLPPTISSGKIYFIDERKGKICILDLEGELLKESEKFDKPHSVIVPYGDSLYFYSCGKLVKTNLNLKTIWETPVKGNGWWNKPTLTIKDNFILLNTCNKVYFLDIDGKLLWEFKPWMAHLSPNPPVLYKNKIFVPREASLSILNKKGKRWAYVCDLSYDQSTPLIYNDILFLSNSRSETVAIKAFEFDWAVSDWKEWLLANVVFRPFRMKAKKRIWHFKQELKTHSGHSQPLLIIP
ncbi:MAG: DnaJ domain-containing protein [Candidatus Aminicenantes bacterium]|nr:DnaJ domain-containing protein [Candidatus Aminicenantes bacterium]